MSCPFFVWKIKSIFVHKKFTKKYLTLKVPPHLSPPPQEAISQYFTSISQTHFFYIIIFLYFLVGYA